jgi:PAS domain S-box-containing protein
MRARSALLIIVVGRSDRDDCPITIKARSGLRRKPGCSADEVRYATRSSVKKFDCLGMNSVLWRTATLGTEAAFAARQGEVLMTDLASEADVAVPAEPKRTTASPRGRRPLRLPSKTGNRKAFRALAGALALVLIPSFALLSIEIYRATSIVPNLQASQALVVRTFAVIRSARGLDHAMQDAERGQRGFLITGDDAYLDPYRAGLKEAPERLRELQQLTSDNPAQQWRIGELDDQIGRKLAEMRHTIETRQKDGFDAARQIVETDIGLDAMRTITGLIDAIIADENELLSERQGHFIEIQRRDAGFGLAAAALALAVMVTGGILLTFASLRLLGSQRSLQESEERFRLLVSGVKDYAILMLDPAGTIVSWNEGAERIKGYRANEIIGSHFSRFYLPEEAAMGVPGRLLEMAAAEGHAEAEAWRLRKDGSRFWASVNITALRDGDGTLRGFAKVTRDITERREHEVALEQHRVALAHLQKMEALGQLTGGVAHDFNNLLTTILGSVELLQRAAQPDAERMARLLRAVQRAAEQGAALTKSLLAFSRRQALSPQEVDVNRLVGSMSEMLRRTLGESIAVETVLAGGLWGLHVDPNQLENAVLNLAINARDAMPQGGKLTIETGNTYLDDEYAAAHSEVTPGQYVMIALSDTGQGMSDEVMEHAFEPFYTTKSVGKGTGLGLSQVYGFVKQSGGHIKLYSEAGFGTAIKIYLPRSTALGDAPPSVPRSRAVATSQSASVLLVEDDPGVRMYAAEALTTLGYEVLQASDSLTALCLLDENPKIALLFTDVGLPDLNGRRLAEEAQRRVPDLKILYTTGYARNAIVHHGILDAGVDLLPKPFTVEALGRKLQQILRGA